MVLHLAWQNYQLMKQNGVFDFGPEKVSGLSRNGPQGLQAAVYGSRKRKKRHFNREFLRNKPYTWLALFDQAWWEPRL